MAILALDLGKSKTVACVYDPQGGRHWFETIATGRQALDALLARVEPDRVVIEVCTLAGWVGDLIREQGYGLQVANPNGPAWTWQNVKRKTDRDDALKLAKLSAMGQLPEVHLPVPKVREWRELIGYRQAQIRRRTQVKNHIRALLSRQGEAPLPASKKGWTQASLEVVRGKAQPWSACRRGNYWRGELHEELELYDALEASIKDIEAKLDAMSARHSQVKRLRTIPGVGARLAEMVVAVLDDPHRFKNGKQVGAYVGLTPRQYQSGSMDRQGRISGQGHKQLRALLVEASWLGLRWNVWMQDVYARVHRGSPARKKIAIVAVARRLLIRCWAMMRDGTDWQGPRGPRREKVEAA